MRKIAFLVREGLDSFINDIIGELNDEFEVKKIIVKNYNQINSAVKWADICWFEWCDELIVYGSNLNIEEGKFIVCRLHSYEAFTEYITRVNWKNVNRLIFVNEFLKKYVLKKIKIDVDKTVVIPNGINTDIFSYKERKKGFNIAYVGYVNYKKGPMLLLHTFKAIHHKEPRFKLHIAGAFQDERDILYFNQMIGEFGLQNSIFFEGWQNDLNSWLEDKNYILCSSILESQNISVMQAMSKGIKPIIHNFVGAKDIYEEKYLWNSIEEAVNLTVEENYESEEYRNFVVEKFSLGAEIDEIKKLLNRIGLQNDPLVTIGIINYNYGDFIDKAVESALNQKYDNIEILIIDDSSTDSSLDKIKNYENYHSRVRAIYHTENSGSAVKAFREIISSAKGEYLIFLSSDDYFPDKLLIRNFVDQFNKDNSLDYVYGNIELMDESGVRINEWRYRDYSDNEIVYNIFKNMGSGVIPLTTGMFKMDFYKRNNINFFDDPNNKVAGDTLNTLINVKYNWRRKYIDITALCYRTQPNNMSYNIKNRIVSIISVIEYIIDNYDESIYMPEVKWNKILDFKIKEALKTYLLGEHYFFTLLFFYKEEINILNKKISFTQKEAFENIEPLISVIEKYLNKSAKLSRNFEKKIEYIKNKLDSIKETYLKEK